MNKEYEYPMDKAWVERKFQQYPKLEIIICGGTMSLKATREILGIDRYEMKNLYLDLLEAGAIKGSGSNCYRATKQLKEYMFERSK